MNSILQIQIRVIARDAQAQIAALQAQVRALEARLRRLNASMSSTTASSAGLSGALAGIGNGLIAAGSGLTRFSGFLGAAGSNIIKFGKNIQWTGRQLEYRFTLPVLAAGYLVTRMVLENEKAMTRLRKVYGDSGTSTKQMIADTKQLEQAFYALSNIFGKSMKEVASIGAFWAQAGATGVTLAKATRATIETMILGEMEAEEAATALIAVMSQYGLTADQLRLSMAQLNKTENETAVSFRDLVDVMQRAGGTARTAGVDIRHLAAMTAAIVPAAGSAEMAGTGLKTMIARIMAPTGRAAEAIKFLSDRIGTDITDSSNSATTRLELLAKAFDGLTPAQRAVTAETIAGKWQINRFDTLLRDIANPLGNYQKILKATSDDTKVLATYQRELGIYLSSTPQAFAILKTQMQNMLAQVMVPLMPAILGVVSRIKDMVHWFTSLSPRVQQTIVLGFLLLAVLGPIISYLGAFTIVAGMAVKSMVFFAQGFMLIGSAALKSAGIIFKFGSSVVSMIGMVVPFLAQLLTSFLTIFVQAAYFSARYAIQFGAVVFTTVLGWARIVAAHVAGWAATTGLQVLGWARSVAIAAAGWAALHLGNALGWARTIASHIGGWVAKVAITVAGWAQIAAVTLAGWWAAIGRDIFGIARSVAIWAAGWAGRIAVTALGWAKVVAINILGWMGVESAAFTGGLLLVAAVGIALLMLREQIGKAFSWIKETILNAWRALPAGIQQAFTAVFRILESAMKAVSKWLSYLNPFARHSPSLVEQVTKGVDLIARKYASLSNVGSVFRKAIDDLKAFKDATQAAVDAQQAARFGEMRTATISASPGSGEAFDAAYSAMRNLQAQLGPLQAEIDLQATIVGNWSAELDIAKTALDEASNALTVLKDNAEALKNSLDAAEANMKKFAEAPITGMKAMNEAIWQNEYAQNQLNLQLKLMEQQGISIDKIKNKMSNLQGEIENVMGNREELRLAGAGSDVLATLDAQIAQMQASKAALSGEAQQVQSIVDQLDSLNLQGEILKLQQSVTFDPLIHQIDLLMDKQQEMNFEEIIAGVQRYSAEMDVLGAQYEQATSAVAAQQSVVDALKTRHDIISAAYDAEKAKLDELTDAYAAIEQQINAMTNALEQFSLAMTGAGGAGSAGGADGLGIGDLTGVYDVPGGPGGGILNEQGDIGKLAEEWAKEAEKSFGSFDLFKPLKKQWREWIDKAKGWWGDFTQWIRDRVPRIDLNGDFFKSLGDNPIIKFFTDWIDTAWSELKRAGVIIGDELKKWATLWDPFVEAVGHIWNVVKVVLGAIFAIFMFIWPTIKSILISVWRVIVDVVKGALEFLRGLIMFVLGVINLDWGQMWEGIKAMVAGVWDTIVGLTRFALDLMWQIIQLAWDAILWVIKLAVSAVWDLVKDVFSGIWNFFQQVWDGIFNTVKTVATNMWALLVAIFSSIKLTVTNTFENIVGFFTSLPGRIMGAIGAIAGAAASVGSAIWDGITSGLSAAGGFIADVASGIWSGIKTFLNVKVFDPIRGFKVSFFGADFKPFASIPRLAEGGIVGARAGGQMALLGEAGRREAVMPLPSGFSLSALASTMSRLEKMASAMTAPSPAASKTEIHFHGDLSFPNIKSGEDAEAFIRNLESLAE